MYLLSRELVLKTFLVLFGTFGSDLFLNWQNYSKLLEGFSEIWLVCAFEVVSEMQVSKPLPNWLWNHETQNVQFKNHWITFFYNWQQVGADTTRTAEFFIEKIK